MPGYPALRAELTLLFHGLLLNFGASEAERLVVDWIFSTIWGVVLRGHPLCFFQRLNIDFTESSSLSILTYFSLACITRSIIG